MLRRALYQVLAPEALAATQRSLMGECLDARRSILFTGAAICTLRERHLVVAADKREHKRANALRGTASCMPSNALRDTGGNRIAQQVLASQLLQERRERSGAIVPAEADNEKM